ncbi:hypothetical protein K3495_g1085 [Podosphaera aphanis]|nr:hypothetical protein K3495_g1085 [Podosphaera aphanis]
MFLFAQGSSVICVHYDTLTVARRFSNHTQEIKILAVDNLSERGAGRTVVSYDLSHNVIIWDCLTGDELVKINSHDSLTVAAWMRNGNVAFGNVQGNVILFESDTSEYISIGTNRQIPITALAPAADNRTYAIGFSDGSLVIAVLQPKFVIVHHLNTSRGPSSLVTLAWHASSSRQKSDLLATQTLDGDVRVWSIAKYPTSAARVIRILQYSENFRNGPNWLGWSKNGRVVQFTENKIISWDVRTKNVTYETVPATENILGLAIFGSGATLFVLGENNTIQQLNLHSPPQLIANVQHSFKFLSSSPTLGSKRKQDLNILSLDSLVDGMHQSKAKASEIEEENQISPLTRITAEVRKLKTPELDTYESSNIGALSPVSSTSNVSTSSRSSVASSSRDYQYRHASSGSHVLSSDGTTISVGSGRSTPHSLGSLSPRSFISDHHRVLSSSLRHEVFLDDKKEIDLFKFTKTRLSDLPNLDGVEKPQSENKDRRRYIFRIIFDWDGEVEDLIEDEISRHPPGSISRLLLAKWLGEIDKHIVANRSESMTSSDWMLLALSGICGQISQNQITRTYVQHLLEKDDIHTAATIMIGMDDHKNAIEVYVSHQKFVEALILTCLVFPTDWQRQDQLIRSLGEWAVQNSEQHLANRCFACVYSDFLNSWIPSTYHDTKTSQQQSHESIHDTLSPSLSPSSFGHTRNVTQSSALRLITSFSDQATDSRYSDIDEDEKTPINFLPSQNEKNDSAFIRASSRSAHHTPMSARTVTPSAFQKQSLPSIGETPFDLSSQKEKRPLRLLTPLKNFKSYEVGGQNSAENTSSRINLTTEKVLTESPMIERPRNLMISPLPLPSPPESLRSMLEYDTSEPLQIQWPPIESIITGNYMTSPKSMAIDPSQYRTSASSTESLTTSSVRSKKSPVSSLGTTSTSISVTGKILEEYIKSVEFAKHQTDELYLQTTPTGPRSKNRNAMDHELSDQGGIPERTTSPTPKSQNDVLEFYANDSGTNERFKGLPPVEKEDQNNNSSKLKLSSRNSRSLSVKISQTTPERRLDWSDASCNHYPRQPSPDIFPTPTLAKRGRSAYREGSVIRSPSSPLPMSNQMKFYREDNFDKINGNRNLNDNNNCQLFSLQNHNKSYSSHNPAKFRESSSEKSFLDRLTGRRHGEIEFNSSQKELVNYSRSKKWLSHGRSISNLEVRDIKLTKGIYISKKEQAARELQERRQSLVKNPSVPPIIHPEEIVRLSPANYRPSKLKYFDEPQLRSQTTPPSIFQVSSSSHGEEISDEKHGKKRNQKCKGFQVGLPATPKAMKLLKNEFDHKISLVSRNIERFNSNEISMGNSLVTPNMRVHESLAHLPRTTYIPTRRTISRSASAPIPEEPPLSPLALPSDLPTHPAFKAALPPSSGRRGFDSTNICTPPSTRKVNPGGSQPGTLGYQTRNKQAVKSDDSLVTKSDTDEKNETPLESPPPILKELQHLAMPPPPPPPPFHRLENPNTSSIVSGISSGSGIIEIIMDDEGDQSFETTAISPSRQRSPDQSNGYSENSHMASSRFMDSTRHLRSASYDKTSTSVSQDNVRAHEGLPKFWSTSRGKHVASDGSRRGNEAFTESKLREYETTMAAMEGGMI